MKKNGRQMTGMIRYVFIVAGVMALGIGIVGVVLPILPSTPFFLLSVVCFTKGSTRMRAWFTSKKLYQKHLDSYVSKRAMTRKTKIYILCSITILMGMAFVLSKNLLAGQICVAVVWLAHVLYFMFRVKSIETVRHSQ
ncbi:MAG: YbaN family protein [Peptococcaceae bacterium]|jgi:uncharacterized membrane protein YbaN (DUF454 family)|nr:YbaN family protein [Peptococcaceae bacterium]